MRISSITKNAGKACNNRLYRHIRTFEKIVKNYFVIYIKKICSESGIVWQEMGIYFTIKLFRIKPPSHIFTEEEIKEVLRAGNDFRNNRLVIDEEGYAQLIDSDLHYECYRYPVSQESYDA